MGFQFRIGGKTGLIPYEGVVLKLGGASNRLVFIQHPSLPDWTVFTSDRSLLKDPQLRDQSKLVGQLNRARAVRKFNWLLLTAVILLVIAVPALFLLQMDQISARLARQIPVEWEQKLADTALAQYRIDQELLDEAIAEPLLEPLVKPLIEALEQPRYQFEFHIVNDSSVNAFALPGGKVVIHSGLIMEAQSAAELMGVLGHEINHVTEQHGLRNVIGSVGVYVTVSALIGDVNGLLASLATYAPLLLNQSYSRGFEREADERGVELLWAAGVDPQGLVQFFRKLVEREQRMLDEIDNDQGRDAMQTALKFLSTHPGSEQRIQYLQELIDSRSERQYHNYDIEFQRLKAEVTDYITDTESSQTI